MTQLLDKESLSSKSDTPKARLDRRKTALLILGLAIAVLLPAAYSMAKPFLTAFVLAAILAVVLDPLRERASRFMKRSSVAALLTTVIGIVPILAVILLAGVVINREIKSGAFAAILRTGKGLSAGFSLDRHALMQKAGAEFTQLGGVLFTSVMAMLFLYVLLLYGRSWVAQLTAMLPLDQSVTNRILSTVRDAIVANVDGILAVAAIEAVVFGIIFRLAGIGSPVMWGALAGLASLTPVVGAMAVWLPIAITLAIHGTYIKALLVGLGCLAGQMTIGTFLRPRVVGSRLPQPPLLIALSVLGGTEAFGALGILLGPVIVSALAALSQEFRLQLRQKIT
jgi:predicted PurR-regulated permease PerM